MVGAQLQYPYRNRHEDNDGADGEKVEENQPAALPRAQISVRLSHRLDVVKRLREHCALRLPLHQTAAQGNQTKRFFQGNDSRQASRDVFADAVSN